MGNGSDDYIQIILWVRQSGTDLLPTEYGLYFYRLATSDIDWTSHICANGQRAVW